MKIVFHERNLRVLDFFREKYFSRIKSEGLVCAFVYSVGFYLTIESFPRSEIGS